MQAPDPKELDRIMREGLKMIVGIAIKSMFVGIFADVENKKVSVEELDLHARFEEVRKKISSMVSDAIVEEMGEFGELLLSSIPPEKKEEMKDIIEKFHTIQNKYKNRKAVEPEAVKTESKLESKIEKDW